MFRKKLSLPVSQTSNRKVIEFVAETTELVENHPPVLASKAMPEWFKQMPLKVDAPEKALNLAEHVTMRGCPGILDFFQWGYILPLWTDYTVYSTPEGFRTMSLEAKTESFGVEKQPGYPFEEGKTQRVLKLSCPWAVRTPRGWSTAILPLTYHNEKRFKVMAGVVDTDRYHFVNMVCEWLLPDEHLTALKAGTPLAMFVPFKRGRLPLETIVNPELNQELFNRGKAGMKSQRLMAGAYREHARRWNEKQLPNRMRKAWEILKGD